MKCHLPAPFPCKIRRHLLHARWNWRGQCENGLETRIFWMALADEVRQSMEKRVVRRLAETLLPPKIYRNQKDHHCITGNSTIKLENYTVWHRCLHRTDPHRILLVRVSTANTIANLTWNSFSDASDLLTQCRAVAGAEIRALYLSSRRIP